MRHWFVCFYARLFFCFHFSSSVTLIQAAFMQSQIKKPSNLAVVAQSTAEEKCRLGERVKLGNDNIHCGVGGRHSIRDYYLCVCEIYNIPYL